MLSNDTIKITDICCIDKGGGFERIYLSQPIVILSSHKEKYRTIMADLCNLKYVFFYFNHFEPCALLDSSEDG